MKHLISLEALEVIDAIARKGSFAAAANELYKVPSAISYSVQKLEQDLDIVLFKKVGRKAVLTDAGKVLLEQGREILAATERLAITAKKTHKGYEPVFTLAIDSLLKLDFIYPYIANFYHLMPDIEINVYEEVLGGTLEAIMLNRADLVIGIGMHNNAGGPSIKYQLIKQIEWVFVCAPSHPLAELSSPISQEQMALHRFVVVRDSSRQQAPLNCRLFGKKPMLRVPSIAEKVAAIQLGLGVGFVPKHRVQDLLEQKLLIEKPVQESIAPESIYMAWKTTNKGKVLRWFIEQLSQHEFS